MIKLTRPPCANINPGTFDLPGMEGCTYTIGRGPVIEATPELMRHGGPRLAVDTESCGLGPLRYDLKCVQVGTEDRAVLYDPRDPAQFEALSTLLSGTDHALVYHNSPFDVPILALTGLLPVEAISRTRDTLIWGRLAEPDDRTAKNLTAICARYLGTDPDNPLKSILAVLGISKETWFQTVDLDTPAYRFMAASDAISTCRVAPLVRKAAIATLTTGHPFPVYGVNKAEAETLADREQEINALILPRTCEGMITDPDYLDTYRADNDAKIGKLAGYLETAGVRPGVNGDMAKWLADREMLPESYPRTRKTKLPSGDKKDLGKLDHYLVKVFLEHKELEHVGSYLEKVMKATDQDGKIHPQVNMLSAVTGRMSVSGDFPYQQMPEAARGILLAPQGRKLVSIDWSQIEPVTMAYMAGDRKALETYESGVKFYQAVATFARLPYKIAKVVVLGSLYGMGLGKLAADLGVSMDEARAIQAKVWEALPMTYELAGRNKKLQKIALKYKKIFTLSGRILPIPHGYWPCWERHDPDDLDEIGMCTSCNAQGERWGVLEHLGVNYPTQGGAYDLLAEAILRVGKAGLADQLWGFMHDELIVLDGAEEDIRKIMETPPDRFTWLANKAMPGTVPVLRTDLAYGIGRSWRMPPED